MAKNNPDPARIGQERSLDSATARRGQIVEGGVVLGPEVIGTSSMAQARDASCGGNQLSSHVPGFESTVNDVRGLHLNITKTLLFP